MLIVDQFLSAVKMAANKEELKKVFQKYDAILLNDPDEALQTVFYEELAEAKEVDPTFTYKDALVPAEELNAQVENHNKKFKKKEDFNNMVVQDEAKKAVISEAIQYYCSEKNISLGLSMLNKVMLAVYTNKITQIDKFFVSVCEETKKFAEKPSVIESPITDMEDIVLAYGSFYKEHEISIKVNEADYSLLTKIIKERLLANKKKSV